MEFVTPCLAIGSVDDAADAALRKRQGIGAVLSLLPVEFAAGAHHLTLPVADRQPLPLAMLHAAVAFIAEQRAAGRKLLVHCRMGISRSPAIVAGYLHLHEGLPLAEALRRVRAARPVADPHPQLLAALDAAAPNDGAAASEHAVDLSANENPLGPAPGVAAALAAAAGSCHRYPDRHGSALRSALAAEWQCQPQQVILGNGSCELLDLAARAFLAPGDEAIIATPSFLPYRSAVRKAHGRLVSVPLRDFDQDLEAMAARVTDRTRLVFLGNPNNPTGRCLPATALLRFLDGLPERVVVVLDEAYREYAAPLRDDTAGARLVATGRPLVAVRTFSKIHALAGLRIGYAIAPLPLAATMEALRPHYNTSALAQAAALAALADAAHVAASHALANAGRELLSRGCTDLGLPVVPSAANLLLLEVGAVDAVAVALAERGVLVKSATPFGLPAHLRVTVGLPMENRRFLAALAEVLAACRDAAAPAVPAAIPHQGHKGDK